MTITLNNGKKISASKEMLNELSLIFYEAGDSYEERGRKALADDAHKSANIIHNALKQSGYYED